MEEYRNKVVNYYATQSQIISKFTSETDQIRLGGPWGGLPPAQPLLAAVFPLSSVPWEGAPEYLADRRGHVAARATPLPGVSSSSTSLSRVY